MENSDAKIKMTKAEAGSLGGKIGGRISKGGGRPKKYHTEAERKAAAVKRQQAYRIKKNPRKDQT